MVVSPSTCPPAISFSYWFWHLIANTKKKLTWRSLAKSTHKQKPSSILSVTLIDKETSSLISQVIFLSSCWSCQSNSRDRREKKSISRKRNSSRRRPFLLLLLPSSFICPSLFLFLSRFSFSYPFSFLGSPIYGKMPTPSHKCYK